MEEGSQSNPPPACHDCLDHLTGELGHLSVEEGSQSENLPICRECYNGLIGEVDKMKSEVARHRTAVIDLLAELTKRSAEMHNLVKKVGRSIDNSFFEGYEACKREVERVFPEVDIGSLAPSPIDASSSTFYRAWYQVSSDSENED